MQRQELNLELPPPQQALLLLLPCLVQQHQPQLQGGQQEQAQAARQVLPARCFLLVQHRYCLWWRRSL